VEGWRWKACFAEDGRSETQLLHAGLGRFAAGDGGVRRLKLKFKLKLKSRFGGLN